METAFQPQHLRIQFMQVREGYTVRASSWGVTLILGICRAVHKRTVPDVHHDGEAPLIYVTTTCCCCKSTGKPATMCWSRCCNALVPHTPRMTRIALETRAKSGGMSCPRQDAV